MVGELSYLGEPMNVCFFIYWDELQDFLFSLGVDEVDAFTSEVYCTFLNSGLSYSLTTLLFYAKRYTFVYGGV